MPSIRTVTVSLPHILGDVVAGLFDGEVTLRLIARLDRSMIELLPVLLPELVLIGLRRGEDDGVASTALALVPAAQVIALSDDGRDAFVHEEGGRRAALADVSARGLAEAILRRSQGAPN